MAEDFKTMDKEYIVNVYNRLNAVLDHGKGSVIYDVNGKEYIDFWRMRRCLERSRYQSAEQIEPYVQRILYGTASLVGEKTL